MGLWRAALLGLIGLIKPHNNSDTWSQDGD